MTEPYFLTPALRIVFKSNKCSSMFDEYKLQEKRKHCFFGTKWKTVSRTYHQTHDSFQSMVDFLNWQYSRKLFYGKIPTRKEVKF